MLKLTRNIIITTVLIPLFCSAQVPQLQLPDGFNATVFLEKGGQGRHLAVRDNGDVYMSTQNMGIVAMRDTNGDGVADQVEHFGNVNGTGIAFHNGMLYASNSTTVYRFHFNGNELVPGGNPEVMISGFDDQRMHQDKPITFDNDGHIYVTVGAPSNACQQQSRTPGSPGLKPCPLLDWHGGIWQFDADKPGQDQMKDGVRYATGIRNAVAIEWNSASNALYFVQHGRDQLDTLWPKYYGPKDNAYRTAEEFQIVPRAGTVYGWPYTYYDALKQQRMVGPEYGGDGKTPAGLGEYPEPIIAFPGHWAPDDIIFYTGDMFPEQYKNGAFIAFHGSWNRAPLEQAGYNVVFVPGNQRLMSSHYSVFADGFRGDVKGGAVARPVGLAQGTDGAVYVSDSQNGTVWKITYNGELGN